MDSRLKLGVTVVRTTAKGFSDDELMTRAAALAFYSALSFAPLLVLLLWVVASLRPEWQAQLIDSLNGLVGARASEAVRLVIENAKQKPSVGSMAGVIGLGVTLIGASAVFAQLQGALNRVYNHFWRHQLPYRHASMNCAGISIGCPRCPLCSGTTIFLPWCSR